MFKYTHIIFAGLAIAFMSMIYADTPSHLNSNFLSNPVYIRQVVLHSCFSQQEHGTHDIRCLHKKHAVIVDSEHDAIFPVSKDSRVTIQTVDATPLTIWRSYGTELWEKITQPVLHHQLIISPDITSAFLLRISSRKTAHVVLTETRASVLTSGEPFSQSIHPENRHKKRVSFAAPSEGISTAYWLANIEKPLRFELTGPVRLMLEGMSLLPRTTTGSTDRHFVNLMLDHHLITSLTPETRTADASVYFVNNAPRIMQTYQPALLTIPPGKHELMIHSLSPTYFRLINAKKLLTFSSINQSRLKSDLRYFLHGSYYSQIFSMIQHALWVNRQSHVAIPAQVTTQHLVQQYPDVPFFQYWNNLVNINYRYYQLILPDTIKFHTIVSAFPLEQRYAWIQPELPLKTVVDMQDYIDASLKQLRTIQFVQLNAGQHQSLVYHLLKTRGGTIIRLTLFALHANTGEQPIVFQLDMGHEKKIFQWQSRHVPLTPVISALQVASARLCTTHHVHAACALFNDLNLEMQHVDIVVPSHDTRIRIMRLTPGPQKLYLAMQVLTDRPRGLSENEAVMIKRLLGSQAQWQVTKTLFAMHHPFALPAQKTMTLQAQAQWQLMNALLRLQHGIALGRQTFIAANAYHENPLLDRSNVPIDTGNSLNRMVTRFYHALQTSNSIEKIAAFQELSQNLENSGNQMLLVRAMKATLLNVHDHRLMVYLVHYLLRYYEMQNQVATQEQILSFAISQDQSPYYINLLARLLAQQGNFENSLTLEWILPEQWRDNTLFAIDCWGADWRKTFDRLNPSAQESVQKAHYWSRAEWALHETADLQELKMPLEAQYIVAEGTVKQPVVYQLKGPAQLRFTIHPLFSAHDQIIKSERITLTDGTNQTERIMFNQGPSVVYQGQFFHGKTIGMRTVIRDDIGPGWHRIMLASHSTPFLIALEKEVPVMHRVQTLAQQVTPLPYEVVKPTLATQRIFIATPHYLRRFYLHDIPTSTLTTVNEKQTLTGKNHTNAYSKMVQLLKTAENNPSKRLYAINQAEKIAVRYPTDHDISEIWAYLAHYVDWSTVKRVDSPAGVRQEVINGWSSDVPTAQAIAAMARLEKTHYLLASGMQYRAKVETRRTITLNLHLRLLSLFHHVAMPTRVSIQVDRGIIRTQLLSNTSPRMVLPITLNPGQHAILVWLEQPISRQYVSIRSVTPKLNQAMLTEKTVKSYYIATRKQPVTVFIKNPGLYLVVEKNHSNTIARYRWIKPGEKTWVIKPAHTGKRYIAIYERVLTPQPTYALRSPLIPLSFKPFFVEKNSQFHIVDPLKSMPLVTHESQAGTITALSAYQQRFSETNATTPIEKFTTLGINYHQHIPEKELYWNASGMTRFPQEGSTVFNLNAQMLKRIMPSLNTPPFSWAVNGSMYTQNSPSNGQLHSLHLHTILQQKRQVARRFFHTPFMGLFTRLQTHDNVPVQDANAIDQDVYANYYRNHAYGGEFGDVLYYQPRWDNLLGFQFSLRTNEDFNPFTPNVLYTGMTWSQQIGFLTNSFSYEHRNYLDKNLTSTTVIQRIYWGVSAYHRLRCGGWLKTDLKAGFDPKDKQHVFVIVLTFMADNHDVDFDDFMLQSMPFKSLMQNMSMQGQLQGLAYAGQ